MRVLILLALVAFVSASPIGEPAAPAPVAPETPAALKTNEGMPAVQQGDLQAAEIEAKALAADQAQMAADQAQLAADQAQHAIDQARMFAEEAAEEQKEKLEEQVAAVKSAQANIEGEMAKNAQLIAQSILGHGIITPTIAGAPVPLVYSAPGILPEVESKLVQQHTEAQGEKNENVLLKSAEPAKMEPMKETALSGVAAAQLGQIGLLGAPLTIPGYTFPSIPSLTPLAYTAPLTYYQPNLPISLIPTPIMAAAIPRAQTAL